MNSHSLELSAIRKTYLAGPIISFNAFASQLDSPQNIYSSREAAWYGLCWVFCLCLMEFITHVFYYNAFAINGLWKPFSPSDIFIIGYGFSEGYYLKKEIDEVRTEWAEIGL